MSLSSPFISTTDDSSSSSTATFALTALIILLAAWTAACGALLWFRRWIAPVYGARVKFNVVTGMPVYRDAALRTLPTPEERREEAEAKRRPVMGPNGQMMQPQSASGESRLGAVCPRGCDDRFWCPPCLLECSCLDCLWCASCCGTPTCGEWMFLRVYRTQAARWIVLVMQVLCLGVNIVALVLNQYSLDSNVAGTGLAFYAGALGLRFDGSSVAYSDCSAATGNMLMQCRTTLIAAGCVFALGLLSSLLFFLSIGASMRMVCAIPYRLYTPGFAVVAKANAVSLTILLLLWGVVPHVVLRHVTEGTALDLKLGWSWGLFAFSWFFSILFAFYFRGAVESVTVQESGDKEAIEQAAADERARAEAERKLYAHPALGDTYGLDQSLGVAARNKVFLVNSQQVELAERRVEASQWTQEGYGSDRGFVSPTAAYAQGYPTPRSLNPLGVSGPVTVVQRGYKANEPIPLPQVLEPTPQEAERMRWQLERDAAWRRAQADAARTRREQRQLQGPFSATAPTYIDTAAHDLAAEEASRAIDNDLVDLQDNGLDARTQLRIFGPQYGFNGAQLPRSLYSYGPDGEELPQPPARDADLDASLRRGATRNQSPAVWTQEDDEQQPEGRSPASARASASAKVLSPSGMEGQRPIAVVSQEEEPEDDTDPGAVPSASNMQFSRLDAAYVRNALPLSDAEMALLMGPGNNNAQQQPPPKARRTATVRQQSAVAELPSEPSLPPSNRAPTSSRAPPMTPKEYREAVAAERAAQPNLLHPSSAAGPQRLPPLPRQPTYLPPLATPHYSYGAQTQLQPAWGGGAAHPFALGSPQRESQRGAGGFDHDGRIYTYVDRAPSAAYGNSNLPSVSSRGGYDLHFASTFSRLPSNHNFAYSPAATGRLQPPILQHQASALPPPRSPQFLHPLSVEVADGGQDPFNRTIPTPMPVVRYTADPTEPDDDARAELDRSHSRRIPLAPQTPRIIEAPGSAAVLRTPHSRRGPYSQAFAF